MTGKLISVEKVPERIVRMTISATEVCSEISSPPGSYHPQTIDHYELSGMQESPGSLVTLTFILADHRRVQFYSTHSKFDMALLLDQLDATIGERRRESHVLNHDN
jgi:hypothetical protein